MFNLGLALVIDLITALGCWMLYAASRYRNDTNEVRRLAMKNLLIAPNTKAATERYETFHREYSKASQWAHLWRRMTFRQPWSLYGPVSISLMYGYQMNEEFWDYYNNVYCYRHSGLRDWRKEICYYISSKGWRIHHGNSRNPMVTLMIHRYEVVIDDYRPNPNVNDLTQAADEYEEIMLAQDIMSKP